MEKMIHLAAQYLATCSISFVAKKEDDSHTNLGLSIESGKLYTRPLNEEGDKMTFDYNSFFLTWESKNGNSNLNLDGKTHEEILVWVKSISEKATGKAYDYNLHYDIPYTATKDFQFKLLDANRMKELLQLRILAQRTLKEILVKNKLESEIRIWPHHFDTGAYAPISEESPISIGLGLATPDTVSNQHYFYISGYKGHDGVDTSKFAKLSRGEWKQDGFKGGVLPANGIELSDAVQFFQEAIEMYKNAK